ncbi:hypothetical protein [Yoonia sp. 208BN28-4]|uniref:hypothetical protein n=1 Tax=Yoonia sp. 208BN28-4 TaxID=3126505 RepID=UPI0030985D78
MFRPCLLVAIFAASAANAQSQTSCAMTLDQSSCNRVVACVGDQGRWFNGRAFGRGSGTFAGVMNDGVTCSGTWKSRNILGMGQADVICDDGMEGRVFYTYQDEQTGTAVGSGITRDGQAIDIWSGNNVLAYLRAQTGEPVAALPCITGAIPLS